MVFLLEEDVRAPPGHCFKLKAVPFSKKHNFWGCRTSGLDFYSYNTELKSLHLVETKKLNVSWYIYTHESRPVLLASGMQCKSFTGYQLSSAGIIRLPRFEITMAKSEANNKPILAAEDVHIIT
ncbi:Colon cancer-associated Mic1-like [Abeliophyllum distichum]|uniref:Colon cancer-associated Mic1-like n=1 Tax=Abeliophyllum distichum TaxID=126358 RepID=A0ABD1RYW4_9LAMI